MGVWLRQLVSVLFVIASFIAKQSGFLKVINYRLLRRHRSSQ